MILILWYSQLIGIQIYNYRIANNKFPINTPKYVPITYPKVPTNITGPTRSIQPFDIAIAAAVVGPPIFALEANIISSKLNLKILPNIKDTNIFIKTTIEQNTKSKGEFFIISVNDAGTPITKKNK